MLDSLDNHYGFAIAAAITSYDSNPEPIEDPEYGELKIFQKAWGHPELGAGFDFHPLETELCNPARDFNNVAGTNLKSDFFQLNPVSE